MLDRDAFLRPIAHRGLHDIKAGVVENTGPAFEAAIRRRYGIECDVRPAAGGLPVVFHDETLDRLVAGTGKLGKIDKNPLKALRHKIGGAPILTLDELLALTRGRVPLLIEIKSEWAPPDLHFLSQVAGLATAYEGSIALMSFDPAVMTEIAKLAPKVPRGIISGDYTVMKWWKRRFPTKRATALRDLLESGPVAPDFYAYDVNALPTPVTEYVRRVSKLPIFTWTVRTPRQRRIAAQWADAMIFEGFEP